MSHAAPHILDTPAKVEEANNVRVMIGDDRSHVWRLGDTCWYDPGTINYAISKLANTAQAVAP